MCVWSLIDPYLSLFFDASFRPTFHPVSSLYVYGTSCVTSKTGRARHTRTLSPSLTHPHSPTHPPPPPLAPPLSLAPTLSLPLSLPSPPLSHSLSQAKLAGRLGARGKRGGGGEGKDDDDGADDTVLQVRGRGRGSGGGVGGGEGSVVRERRGEGRGVGGGRRRQHCVILES